MILRYALLCVFSLLFTHQPVHAQTADDWQQRITYEIDVTLHADRHQMNGHEFVHYQNNSPDTLRKVYFHLYFNAFHPQSMMAARNRDLPDPDGRIVPRIFNLGPDEIGYHRIETIRQNGTRLDFRITDTVMEVMLAEPIAPGASASFDLSFRSQIPLQTRRSGRDNREGIDYSMSQWYPKIAAYDKRGWHADPYVGREFYAPFGTFDVRITLPSEYVIGATGVLQNPEDIGHGYSEEPLAVTEDSLTWHFRAENVHDFAWAADPDYVHDILETENGTAIHLLYQPAVADVWQRLHEWAPAIMEFFSANYGQYPYPQMTVAQAGDGGMEYPMITFVTGRRSPPSLRGVTAHEMAHMWYYGVVASNEADYAWLDEGFGSYITTEVTGHLTGNPSPSHAAAHLNVLLAQHRGLFEPLNTPSDWFRTNHAYGIASYSGGEMVVDMLGYVISDSLRDRFLDEYFERFMFRHPDPYDVEKVAEDVSGLRLDWYFEQFGNTEWTLDYAIDEMDMDPTDSGWTAELTLVRESDVAMPVDLRLQLADGTEQWVTIPLTIMHGHKPVPDDWLVADPWGWTHPEYTLRVDLPSHVVRAEIDPLLRTPDRNRLNNTSRFPMDVSFLEAPQQRWTRYSIGWRPLAQYAHSWGVGAGIQARGTYLFGGLRTQAMIKIWPEVLFSGGDEPSFEFSEFVPRFPGGAIEPDDVSPADGVDYSIRFSNPQRFFGRYGTIALQSRKHLGIMENAVSLSTLIGRHDLLTSTSSRLSLELVHQASTTVRSFLTPVSAGFDPDHLVSAGVTFLRTSPKTRFEIGLETGGSFVSGASFGSANRAYLDAAHLGSVGPFAATTRIFLGRGAGSLASQKAFRLGTATYENRWGSDAYRTIGAMFEKPWNDTHWVAFSGPGPVAYARRDLLATVEDVSMGSPIGRNIVAASARLIAEAPSTHTLVRPLSFEIFFGAGDVWQGDPLSGDFDGSELLFDAGLGLHYDVSDVSMLRQWTAQSDVLSNLRLAARFPIWASDPFVIGDDSSLAFRWLLGVIVDDPIWK